METLLKVTEKQVDHLIGTPKRAVDLFRDLIWAEGGRQMINPSKIGISDLIYLRDGGIDGTTIDMKPEKEGLISEGTTYFQIKWGKNFDPRKKYFLKKELIDKKKLKPKLQELEKNGRYVLVWFGGIFKSNEKEKCIEAIKEIFNHYKFSDVNVDVLDRQDLASYCSSHPVIQSTYFNELSEYFLTIDKWKDRFWNTPTNDEKSIVDILKANYSTVNTLLSCNLTNPYKPVQLLSYNSEQHKINRVLVYKILEINGLRQKTICIDAKDFRPPLSTTLETRSELNQIIVVDNCTETDHKQLLDIIGERTSRLNLIVLSTDESLIKDGRFAKIGWHGSENSLFLNEISSRNKDELITKTPLYYESKVPELKKIALPEPIAAIYDKIRDEYGYEFLNSIKRTLRFLALFTRVSSEKNRTNELEFLSKKIGFEKTDWLSFVEIIHTIRKHEIIKGDYYIKISNDELRQYLIQDWWEIYGTTIDFKDFIANIYAFSENLASNLIDSLAYITTSESGKKIASNLLSEYGIFATGTLLRDSFGARLFSKLAEADPESALACLGRTIGKWDEKELLEFGMGRREIVFSLEKIAWWKNLFTGSAMLLLKLGECENEEGISNNASGVFAELFSPGYGQLAPTEASPKERFVVLKSAFESTSDKANMLALKACDKALESHHFMRIVSGEQPWLRREIKPWTPKTYGEIFDSYRSIWNLLERQLEVLKDELKTKCFDILTSHARGLIIIKSLSDMVLETLTKLSKRSDLDTEKIVESVASILRFEKDNLDKIQLEKICTLNDDLAGTDFQSRMKRYVGMSTHFDRDVEKGKMVDKVKPIIAELASEAISNKTLIEKELDWLVTNKAKRGHDFGYELGIRDKNFELWSLILKTQKKLITDRILYFISGYFRAIFEIDPKKSNRLLDKLSKNTETVIWIPELIYRSRINLTDNDAIRILHLAQKKSIDIKQFSIFYYGGPTRTLSEPVFLKWVRFLLEKGKIEGYLFLLEIYHFYYLNSGIERKLPKKPSYELLTSSTMFKNLIASNHPLDIYSWTEIAKAFVCLYPQEGLKVLEKIIEESSTKNSFMDRFDTEFDEVLRAIAVTKPNETWELIKKYLGPPIDLRAYLLKNWLHGTAYFSDEKEGALVLFPPQKIFEWADDDPTNRAPYLASLVPNKLFREEGKICFARELLVKYGKIDDVYKNLIANFSTEGFRGSEVEHHKKKKESLINFSKDEDNENVKSWIDEYVTSLNYHIERAKQFEEGYEF